MAVRKIGIEADMDVTGVKRGVDTIDREMGRAEQSVGKAGAGLAKIGGTFAKGLAGLAAVGAGGGLLLAGGVAAGFGEALGRGALNDELAAGLGLSVEEAKRAGDLSGDVYAGAWGDSIEQVNDTIALLDQQGLIDFSEAGSEAAKEATTDLLDLAKVMKEDVGAAAKAAGQLVKNGLAADAEEAFDLLAAGQTNGLNRAEDLLDTLNEYSPAFARMGFSGQEALSLIGSGLDAGAFSSDKIGDAINEFSVRAIDGSDAVSSAFDQVEVDATRIATAIAAGGPSARAAFDEVLDGLRDIDDEVQQDKAGVALFGSMWEDLGSEAILALDPISGKFDDIENASENLSDTLNDNLMVRIEALKRQGFGALAAIAESTLIPALEKILPPVERFAQGLAAAFDLFKDPEGLTIQTELGPLPGLFTHDELGGLVELESRSEQFASAIDALFGAGGSARGPIVSFLDFLETVPERVGVALDAMEAFFASPEVQASGTEFERLVDNVALSLTRLFETKPDGESSSALTDYFSNNAAIMEGFNDAMEGNWRNLWDGLAADMVRGLSALRADFLNEWGELVTDFTKEWDDFGLMLTRVRDSILGWVDSLPGAGLFFGSDFNPQIPTGNTFVPELPGQARGGRTLREGLTRVGERGEELLNLPRGAEVIPLSGANSLDVTGGGGSTVNNFYTIEVGGSLVAERQLLDLIASSQRAGATVTI